MNRYFIEFRMNFPEEKKRLIKLAIVEAREFEFARRNLCAWFNENHLNDSSSIEILSKEPWDRYKIADVYV